MHNPLSQDAWTSKEQIFSEHPCNQNLFGQSRLKEESELGQGWSECLWELLSTRAVLQKQTEQGFETRSRETPPAVHAGVMLDVPFNCFL